MPGDKHVCGNCIGIDVESCINNLGRVNVDAPTWFSDGEKAFDNLRLAVSAETGSDMDAMACGEESAPHHDGLGYMCSRAPGHPGRHIAVGVEVVAAWPGTHQPTMAELRDESTEVPDAR